MYRQYENPRKLEQQLEELRNRKHELELRGELNEDMIEYFALEEHELEERINFAWQDDEFDSNYERDNYGF